MTDHRARIDDHFILARLPLLRRDFPRERRYGDRARESS